MSFEIKTDRNARFVEVVYHGGIDADEVRLAISRMPEVAPFEKAAAGLSDFRDAKLELEMEDLKSFVEEKDPQFFSGARWALLVRHARDTALGLIYERMEAQVYEVKIFSQREAALEWLDVPEPSV